jgi:hypothetical protein
MSLGNRVVDKLNPKHARSIPQESIRNKHEFSKYKFLKQMKQFLISKFGFWITLKITRLSPSPLVGEGGGEGGIQYPPPPRSSPVKGEDHPG